MTMKFCDEHVSAMLNLKDFTRNLALSENRGSNEVVRHLKSTLNDVTYTGFKPGAGAKMNALRRAITSKIAFGSEADAILTTLNVNRKSFGFQRPEKSYQIAALKLYRHCYAYPSSTGRTTWIVSTPKRFKQSPQDEIRGTFDFRSLRNKLNDTQERWSEAEKMQIVQAASNTKDYCDKAIRRLSNVKSDKRVRRYVKEWFRPEDSNFDHTVRHLLGTFGKMRTLLTTKDLFFVDAYTRIPDAKKSAIAFVHGHAQMPVVYTTRKFFEPPYEPNTPLFQVLAVLHELSHLAAHTEDHRYANGRIRVEKGFSTNDALTNADSIAHFAANCAGTLPRATKKLVLRKPEYFYG